MIQELSEMQRMAGASALALELQTKKNQQLLSQLHTAEAQIARLLDDNDRMTSERDNALDESKQLRQAMMDGLDRWKAEKKMILESRDNALTSALAKDAELGALAGKLASAQAVVDAAREANVALTCVRWWEPKDATVINAYRALESALAAYDAALEAEAKP